MSSFYTQEELKMLGFASVGTDVFISKKASVYSAENMSIGNHVRVDDFCFLSGKITIGNFVHIATASLLYGGTIGITMEDFSGVSPRVTIFATSNDYTGNGLTNPMTVGEYQANIDLPVSLGRHVIVGTGTTILPGVIIGTGSSVGAMSLANKSLPEWKMCAGIPCRPVKERSKKILELESAFLSDLEQK